MSSFDRGWKPFICLDSKLGQSQDNQQNMTKILSVVEVVKMFDPFNFENIP